MPLPDNFYDDDVHYRIRLCTLVEECLDIDLVTSNSKVHACDSCDRPIWVDEAQTIPPMPEDMELTGDVNVCGPCMSIIYERSQMEEVEWLKAPPQAILDGLKEKYGI